MFNYNAKDKLLEISVIPLEKTETIYEISDAYKSYEQYKNHGLEEDIREILMPLLNNIVSPGDEYIWVDNCDVRFDNTANYKGYEYNSAFVTLGGLKLSNVAKPFCMFKLPYMDEYGIIKREGKQYALINELVQDDDITYNDGELKIITKGGFYVNLKSGSKEAKITYRRKNHSAMTMLFALAQKEGLDCYKLYEKMRSKDLLNVYKDELQLDAAVIYSAEAALRDPNGFIAGLESDEYSLINVRDRVNKVLSIDRALGKTLSKEVLLRSGEIIPAETVVNSIILKKLKANRINEVYVFNVPNMVGYYIAEDVRLIVLRKGTRLVEALRDEFPDYKGSHLDKDYAFSTEDAVIIEENTPVSKGLLEMLAYNGHTDVKLKQSENSTSVIDVPLEVAIIGNRHFKAEEIGVKSDTEYVYVNEDDSISAPKERLCAYDLLAMIVLFDRLCKGEDYDIVANRDLGMRKKVNQANESFHKAFKLCARDFVNIIKETFRSNYNDNPQVFANPDVMEAMFFKFSEMWWSKLFIEMKVINKVEMDNPVAFYSSFSKINAIVKDRNAITNEQHGLSMGHYGRLCPYETPAGKTLGIVCNRAVGCKIDNGIMKTSYYRVKHIAGKHFIDFKTKLWLSVPEEEKYRIADIVSLRFKKGTGEIETTSRVLARIPCKNKLEKVTVSHIDVSKIDLVNTSPNQSDSLTATTIPFQGANDSARVVFGLSMCKQAKALLNPEAPLVMTSAFIDIPRKSPYFMIHAEYDGIVIDQFPGAVTMFYPEVNETKTYYFKAREFSKSSIVIRALTVDVDQQVKAGDVLVTSNFIDNGYLATGVNCLVAYVPEGSNYEDGVFGSQRLAGRTTSYGPNMEEEPIPKEFKQNKIGYVDKFKYRAEGTTLFSLRHIAGSESTDRRVRSKKLKGFILDTSIEVDKYSGREKSVKTYSVSFNRLHTGDKLANRHGNKGVTPKIIGNEQMPRFKNGEFVDLCYNPAGVSSRMNIGQVLECNLGLAAYILGIRVRSDSFNGASVKDIKLLLSYAWNLANGNNANAVVSDSKYSEFPQELHEHVLDNIDKIRLWKGSFNEDGTAWLYNPRTGKYFETPALVGINYVYKLIHEALKKEHARGGLCTEPYVPKLSAPTHGSQKRGGQRFGYMELDALAAYGASAYIDEIMNERGDNAVRRNNVTASALHKGDAYQLNESTAIRRSTEAFVNIFESLGVKIDFEGELPNNTKAETKMRQVYNVSTLLKANFVGNKEDTGQADLGSFSDSLGSL